MIRRHPALWLLIALAAATTAHAAPPALPHLDDLAARFGARPDVGAIALSPEGNALVVVAPIDGTRSVAIVHDLGTDKRAPIIADTKSEFALQGCTFKTDVRLICTLFTPANVEGTLLSFTRIFAVDRDGRNVKLLGRQPTAADSGPMQSSGEILDLLPDDPAHIVMGIRARVGGDGSMGLGAELVDVTTTRMHTLEPYREENMGLATDSHGHVRIRSLGSKDFSGAWKRAMRYAVRAEDGKTWTTVGTDDLFSGGGTDVIGFDGDDKSILALKPKDGRRALYRLAADGSGHEELLFASDKVDVDGVMRIGKYARPVAARYTLDSTEYKFFDSNIERLARLLRKALPDTPQVTILDESWNGKKKLIYAGSDTNPGTFYIYNADTHELALLFAERPELVGRKMAAVRAVDYAAADRTRIPAYLTLPPGKTDLSDLPAIVMPHGGPSARDERGFDWLAQFWAASGYAVLQPNFRGSSGYGEKWFVENGFKSWHIAMGDINDGARWLLSQHADASRLAIFGWSYGGYAALQANVLDPKLYKAAIAVAPVTDLSLLKSESAGFEDERIRRDFIGTGPHIVEGSPAKNAARIGVPVLIFQGDKDLNVDIAQARRMDAALVHAGKPHRLIVYPGLDHQLDDGDARADMLRRSAAFLVDTMGAPVSPVAASSTPK